MKSLSFLHRCNAWIVLWLAITGSILYMPGIRGELGVVRVWLKNIHIALGVLSLLLILAYLPLAYGHWKRLRKSRPQKANLLFVLFLLIGWGISGLMLWQFRILPPAWTNAALKVHDLLTWIGIPYALYHSMIRSRWVKDEERRKKKSAIAVGQGTAAEVYEIASQPTIHPAASWVDKLKYEGISRKTFLKWLIGTAFVIGAGPTFYRWIKRVTDEGGEELDWIYSLEKNSMLPDPIPLPESNPRVGGGAKGRFRIYSVTEIPSFTSEQWQFSITGLVNRQLVWNWNQFLELPRSVQVNDFHCVTGWSVYQVTWEGIRLSSLLEQASVKNEAQYVKFYSGDGIYTDALSLEQAKLDDVLVAVLMDGKPIPQQLGGPVRLIVPRMYAYKSVKWLQAIELIDKEHLGYWEVRGYDNDAWIRSTS
jgi:methionine sulfoxide reductase catalytic subunit